MRKGLQNIHDYNQVKRKKAADMIFCPLFFYIFHKKLFPVEYFTPVRWKALFMRSGEMEHLKGRMHFSEKGYGEKVRIDL